MILLICTFLSILFSNFKLSNIIVIYIVEENYRLDKLSTHFPFLFLDKKRSFSSLFPDEILFFFLQVPVFQEYNPFKFTSNLFENSPMLPSFSSTVKTADKKKLSAKSYALEPTPPPPPLSKKGCYQVNNKAPLSNKVTMYFPSWYDVYDKQ